MSLSACLIVKDEQKYLPFCLKSLKNFASEIIVVDTGSIDKTPEIARKLGARVFKFKWQNDFSAARNFSLSKAQGDWLLVIDADEFLPEDSGRKIQEILQKPEAVIYSLPIFSLKFSERFQALKNIKTAKPSRIYYLRRLFKNNLGLKFINSIHEYLDPGAILEKNLTGQVLAAPLGHYGFDLEKNKRSLRNLTCAFQGLKKQKNDYSFYYNYGKTLREFGFLKLGQQVLEKSLDLGFLEFASSEKTFGLVLSEIQKEISQSCLDQKDFQNALENYALTFLLEMKDPKNKSDFESLFQMALIYLYLKQKELAKKILRFIVKSRPVFSLEEPPTLNFNPNVYKNSRKLLVEISRWEKK